MDTFTQRMLERAQLRREKQLRHTSLTSSNFTERKKLIVTVCSAEEQCSSFNIFKQAPTPSENNASNTTPQTNAHNSSAMMNSSNCGTCTICYKNNFEVLYDNANKKQQFLNSNAEMIENDIPKACRSKSDINIKTGEEVFLAEELYEIEGNKDDADEVQRLTAPLCMQDVPGLTSKHSVTEEQDTHNQIQNLYTEFQKQDILKQQCSKAVAVCKQLKQFTSSLEYLEAERFLLIFSLKQEAVEKEICHLQHDSLENVSPAFGTLHLDMISFPLSEQFLKNILNEKYEYWFVFVGVHSVTVQATQVSRNIQEGRICFTESLCFMNLPHLFSIKLMLFYMKLKKNKFSHEEKYRIPKERKQPKFPIVLRQKRSASCHLGEQTIDMWNALAFKLIATKTLMESNIEKGSSFFVDKVENPNIIEGNMYVQLCMDVTLSIRHTGFLDIMAEHKDHCTWERYWCRLSGYSFSYWKYPSDEDIKSPEGNVDLRASCSNKVEPADKDLCPRPRTLLLVTWREPLKGDSNSILKVCKPQLTLIRHFWSADSLQELTQWCTQINKVLSTLEEWYLLKIGVFNQEPQISTVL